MNNNLKTNNSAQLSIAIFTSQPEIQRDLKQYTKPICGTKVEKI
jgi:hypothetical protein